MLPSLPVQLVVLPYHFSVCQIHDPSEIPFSEEFVFVGKTDDELSLVCRSVVVPAHVQACEDGWKMIKIQGVLDFFLVGILAPIASILAKLNISIFVVSTYNTDYILLKEEKLLTAVSVLTKNGYDFI